MALAGSQQAATGACCWLGSPPSSQDVWTFLRSAYELGKRASRLPCKLSLSLSFSILVPRGVRLSIFLHIDTALALGSNTEM